VGSEPARQASAGNAVARLVSLAGGDALELPLDIVDGEADGAIGRFGGLVTDDVRAERSELYAQIGLDLAPRLVTAQHQLRPWVRAMRQRVVFQALQTAVDALLHLSGQREALHFDPGLH
jgi:hypothetical protein